MTYRPEIDGLRAIAVMVVVLYHLDISWLSGGYIGVDVFFVISGYLITSIISREIESGTFTVVGFYRRRVRRIFPALFAVTFVSIIPAMWIFVPKDLENFGQSVISIGFFVQNFLFYSEDVYFGGPAELKPLLHTWSLAVEEQFYLFFPLLCVAVARFRLNFFATMSTLGVASLLFGTWWVSKDPEAAFFLLPARLWELLLGSLIANSPALRERWQLLASSIGAAMIFGAAFFYNEQTTFPGLSALLPCLGTAFLLLGTTQTNLYQKVLSWKPLVFLGLISYSLYLWHFPIISFSKRLLARPFDAYESLAILIISIALAYLSWKFIEAPFRGSKTKFNDRMVKWLAIGCVVLATAFGLYTDAVNGAPDRFSPEVQKIIAAKNSKDAGCRRKESCLLGQGKPVHAILGDSHADAMLAPFRDLAERHNQPVEVFTHGGCLPMLGYQPGISNFAESCRAHNQATFDQIMTGGYETVFLIGRWTIMVEQSKFKFEHGKALGAVAFPDVDKPISSVDLLSQSLDATIEKLLSAGMHVVLVGPVPEAGWDVPYALAQRIRFKGWLDSSATNPTWEEFQMRNQRTLQVLYSTAEKHLAADLVLPHTSLCTEENGCIIEKGGVPLYYDPHHLTPKGASLLEHLIAPYFEAKGSPMTELR